MNAVPGLVLAGPHGLPAGAADASRPSTAVPALAVPHVESTVQNGIRHRCVLQDDHRLEGGRAHARLAGSGRAGDGAIGAASHRAKPHRAGASQRQGSHGMPSLSARYKPEPQARGCGRVSRLMTSEWAGEVVVSGPSGGAAGRPGSRAALLGRRVCLRRSRRLLVHRGSGRAGGRPTAPLGLPRRCPRPAAPVH
jgi:hypothetical protein